MFLDTRGTVATRGIVKKQPGNKTGERRVDAQTGVNI